MAISRSATIRLSFAFSACSARRRFMSLGSSSPYFLRHPYNVCSLTVCLRATSDTMPRSASRRIATICSSVNLLFLVGSSPLGEGHSLNLSLVRKCQAGHRAMSVPRDKKFSTALQARPLRKLSPGTAQAVREERDAR